MKAQRHAQLPTWPKAAIPALTFFADLFGELSGSLRRFQAGISLLRKTLQ